MAFDIVLRDPGTAFDIVLSSGAATQTGDFDADAILLATAQDALGADATLLAILSSSATADAVLEATSASVVALDAALLVTNGFGLQADAVVLSQQGGGVQAEAVLLGTESQGFEAGAAIRAVVEEHLDVDAVVLDMRLGDFTNDATIFGTELGSFTADAYVSAVVTGQYTLDAAIRATVSGSGELDAVLQAVIADALAADATLLRSEDALFIAQATLSSTHADVLLADAIVLATEQGSTTLDAIVGGQVFTLDAVISSGTSFTLDAFVGPTFRIDATICAVPGIHQQAVGTWAVSISTTATVTLPAHAAGDMLLVRAACKPYTATITMATSGWQPVADKFANGSTANGNGVGSLAFRVFWKVATSSSEANPVVTWGTTAAPGTVTAIVYRKGCFERWFDPVGASGGDSGVAAGHIYTMSPLVSAGPGDMLDAFAAYGDNVSVTAFDVLQEALTLEAITKAPSTNLSTTTSNDMAAVGGYRLATAGEAIAPSVVQTYGSSGQGGAWVTRLSLWATRFTLDAELSPEGEVRDSSTLDASIVEPVPGWFTVGGLVQAVYGGTFTLDAFYDWLHFPVEAIIGTVTHPTGYYRVRAWLDIPRWVVEEVAYLDAYIDSSWSEDPFTLDAEIIDTLKEGSFTVGADVSLAGEERGAALLDATIRRSPRALFNLYADVVQATPFRLDAVIRPALTLDAYVAPYATLDAEIAYGTTLDAVTLAAVTGAVTADAVIDIAWHPFTLDAQVTGTVTPDAIELVAYIVGTVERTLTLDAFLMPAATLDAFVAPYFRLDAYIMGTAIVVYPPSQAGDDGEVLGTATFHSESGEFDPSMTTITIDGVPYAIVTVPDEHTVVVSPDLEVAGNEIPWAIPSGSPTDPLGNGLPVITRRFRVRILAYSPPDAPGTPIDLTPDVIWAETEFTQSARYGPGTFRITLKGTTTLKGGEEIHVEIEDFRVFGGYISQVERGYVFADAYNIAKTVLIGTDYNVLFDRLIVYNAAWDRQHGPGEYRNWQPFPKGTSDRAIIAGIVNNSLTDMEPYGFDFTTYVDEIDTPAPEVPWTMQAGTTWRTVMQSISQVTAGVWWIDAYKNLHYHDRSTVTAPFPITDGDGGVTTRNLKITEDISPMVSDAIVWGTLAYTTAGEIMVAREPADSDSSVRYWERKIDRLQPKIDKIMLIPASERTLKQKSDLAAYRKTLAIYLDKYERAQEAALEGLPEGIYGRWQYGEFRNDIHHLDWLSRRARSIFERYGVPVVKAEATVFDLGFSAGMVVSVVSSSHGLADDLVIRQMTLRFAVGKEPVGGVYYAVPQFDLVIGLDPEEPWNIYDYLPWPIDIKQRKFDRGGSDDPPEGEVVVADWYDLDSFNRLWGPGAEFLGEAANDLDTGGGRWWQEPGGGGG